MNAIGLAILALIVLVVGVIVLSYDPNSGDHDGWWL